jgi:HAE1 family hydrophobic/amphiphilic exporter-1
VMVRTSLPGASVEEAETQVSEILEEAVNRVEGINELRSVSMPRDRPWHVAATRA